MFNEFEIVRIFIHGDVWLSSVGNMLPHALVINKVKMELNTSVKIFLHGLYFFIFHIIGWQWMMFAKRMFFEPRVT